MKDAPLVLSGKVHHTGLGGVVVTDGGLLVEAVELWAEGVRGSEGGLGAMGTTRAASQRRLYSRRLKGGLAVSLSSWEGWTGPSLGSSPLFEEQRLGQRWGRRSARRG